MSLESVVAWCFVFSSIMIRTVKRIIRKTYNVICDHIGRPLSSYDPNYINLVLPPSESIGLKNDVGIMSDTLEKIGFRTMVTKRAWQKPVLSRPLITIFFEQVHTDLLNYSPVNLLFPNPEFSKPENCLNHLHKIDYIICKSKNTEAIFRNYHNAVYYTSFSSHDKYLPAEKTREFVHLPGKSTHKGTRRLIDLWNMNPDLPMLNIYNYSPDYSDSISAKNINYHRLFIDDQAYSEIQNRYLFHICPSETEGFGHYINEAKSTGAVIFTTDAPPMNELIDEQCGFLIKANADRKINLAVTYLFDQVDLARKLAAVVNLGSDTSNEMSAVARMSFLQNEEYFLLRLSHVIKEIIENHKNR